MDEQVVVGDAPLDEAPVEIEAPTSLEDHEAQYGPHRDEDAPPPSAASTESAAVEAKTTEQQRREKATGRFTEGKARHRAESQKARAGDVPRINELTRKLKERDDELSRLRAQAPAQAAQPFQPPVQRQEPQAPPQAAAPQRRWLGDTRNDPEPQERDFGGDPMKFLDARYEWLARGVNRFDRKEQQDHQERESVNISFATRAHSVAQAKPDFEQVVGALDQSRRIPAGSAIDQFILTDDKGPDVLYHLASNTQELDALLRIPVLQQIKHLALLSQRYDTASPLSVAAGTTTSAPRSNVRYLPPRPPNVVRTEAQRGESAPPSADGTLAGHEKQYGPRRQR